MMSPLHAGTGLVAQTVRTLVAPTPDARPPGTAQALAALLDLQGSVQLADCLREARRAASSDPGADEAPGRVPLLLGDYVRKRLASIEQVSDERFVRRSDRAATRLPDAAEAHAQLVANDAFASPAGAKIAAATIARAYRAHFLSSVARGRTEIAVLRDEVADDLRKAGANGARLEAIDRAVRAGTEGSVAALVERLAGALESALERRLVASLRAMRAGAETPSVADVEPWFAPTGPLGEELARARGLARGLLRRDAHVLDALVEGALRGGTP